MPSSRLDEARWRAEYGSKPRHHFEILPKPRILSRTVQVGGKPRIRQERFLIYVDTAKLLLYGCLSTTQLFLGTAPTPAVERQP